MMRKLLFFLFIISLFSCAPVPRKLVVPEVSETELLRVVTDNAASFTSLKGIAKISLSENGKKAVKGKHILLVKKPHQVRTEILGLLGQPMAVAVVNSGKAAILVPRERTLYEGNASPRNVQRILRIPLEVKDLVNFILYEVPLIKYRSATLDIPSEGGFRLTLHGEGDLMEELGFNGEKKLVKARLRNKFREILTVRYGEFSKAGSYFPQHMELSLPGSGIEARIEFSSVQTNVEIDDELFHLVKPEGFQVRRLL